MCDTAQRAGITVSTIHAVKGAQLDIVTAFSFLQDMLLQFSDSDGDVASSKLLYVLVSRVRKLLHFISEAGRSHGRYGSYDPTEALARREFDYKG